MIDRIRSLLFSPIRYECGKILNRSFQIYFARSSCRLMISMRAPNLSPLLEEGEDFSAFLFCPRDGFETPGLFNFRSFIFA